VKAELDSSAAFLRAEEQQQIARSSARIALLAGIAVAVGLPATILGMNKVITQGDNIEPFPLFRAFEHFTQDRRQWALLLLLMAATIFGGFVVVFVARVRFPRWIKVSSFVLLVLLVPILLVASWWLSWTHPGG
jgi:hypothetical protein